MVAKIKLYFSEVASELRKVNWPSRNQLVSQTILVLVSILVSMAIVAVIDLGLTKLLEMIISE